MRVVIVESAEYDLKELRSYIINNFSTTTWHKTYGKLKNSIRDLKQFPLLGAVPAELESLNVSQYRQITSGMNRIIYEPRADVIYIHMIIDTRRDLQTLLMQRLLR